MEVNWLPEVQRGRIRAALRVLLWVALEDQAGGGY